MNTRSHIRLGGGTHPPSAPLFTLSSVFVLSPLLAALSTVSNADTQSDTCESPTIHCVAPADQEFAEIQEALNLAQPGDEVRVFPGTYGPFALTASGVESAPIRLAAAETTQVQIDGQGQTGITIAGHSYVSLDGFSVSNCGESPCISIRGTSSEQLAEGIQLSRVSVRGTVKQSQYNAAWEVRHTRNLLLEDIWGFGQGASILQIYQSHTPTVRRALLRHDGGGGNHYYKPALHVHQVTDGQFENIITLDSAATNKAAFYVSGYADNVTTPFAASMNNRFQGLIALNNPGIGFLIEAGTPLTGNQIEHLISWGNGTGIASNKQSANVAMTHLTLGANTGNATWFNPYANVGEASLMNSLLVQNGGRGISGNLQYDYNTVFNNTAGNYYYASPGENDLTEDPRLKFILRIEENSSAYGTASDGGHRGATVTHQYRNGQLTENSLWPWPHEAEIQSALCDPSALTELERTGEQVPAWCQSGQSLTDYLWGKLGNPCPEAQCGGVTTGPKLQVGIARGVSNTDWTPVTLSQHYSAPVVVTTPLYGDNAPPLVTRIRNAQGNSFELMLQRADLSSDPVSPTDVHYLVVEAGVYTEAEHGIRMEAVMFETTTTDRAGRWQGEARSYAQPYQQPVVLGQVMTAHDPRFSTFWSRGASRSSPPDSTHLFAGKQIAEDPDTERAPESVGYVVIEAGTGQIAGWLFHAARGADIIDGVPQGGDHYSHTVDNASVAVATQAAMDGGNGGWAVLLTDPASSSANQTIHLAIDEDQLKDSERNHTTEQVDFIVFGQPFVDTEAPTVPGGLTATLENDVIQLQWKPSEDNVQVTRYDIRRNGALSSTTNAPSLVDGDVFPGETYIYEVSALDAAGNQSAFSAPLALTVPVFQDTEAPQTPHSVTTTQVLPHQVQLSWAAATDNVGVTAYRIYRDDVALTTTSSTFFTDSTALPDTTYVYQITALDAAGNQSARSDELVIHTPPAQPPTGEDFSFIVFGDFNGGGCERNDRVNRLVQKIASEEGQAAFYMSTGDLIDGYWSGNQTVCFATDPALIRPDAACGPGVPNGNMADILAPLKLRPPMDGLNSSFYFALGNHDDNWGSNWYPDPCGEGICEFLAPQTPADFINHPYEATTICNLEQSQSSYPNDFYYSFTYQGVYFIVLRQNNDYFGMLSCNGHPGYDNCESYCAAPEQYDNPERNNRCYSVEQFDWLRAELKKATEENARHIFVFAHAPLITSVQNHPATQGHEQIRALLESYNVDIFFNGHNHAYERTHALRGNSIDSNGTVYITTGSGGALTDSVEGDWFTAYSAADLVPYGAPGFADKMTTYLKVTVNDAGVSGEMHSLGYADNPKDTFTLSGTSDAQLRQSALSVENLSQTTAQIRWQTNLPATSQVRYGLTATLLTETESRADLATEHGLWLNNLLPDTLYYYQAVNQSQAEEIQSPVASFRTPTAPQPGTGPVIGGCSLFPADNHWNTPIDDLPVHPRSADYIANIGSSTPLHPDFGTTWNGIDIGIPFDIIPDTQPFVDVTFDYWEETDPLELSSTIKQYPVPDNPSIEGGAPPHIQTGDNHVLLVRQDSCILYELFAVVQDANGDWTAGSGAVWPLNENTQRPEGYTSADAAGLPILPGLVRYEEVYGDPQQGIEPGIHHALRITLERIQSGYVRPASHSDGQAGHNRAFAPMGLRLRLKQAYDISGFDPALQVILTALKKYGAIVADTGGDMFLSGTHDDRWDDGLLHSLEDVPASAFEAIYTGDIIDY